ncbi:MAG TPA: hypothetical protein VFB58_07100 [Chloroflexota bacterium]|nr:hypothetical protein [Chloroflexota bacterium]
MEVDVSKEPAEGQVMVFTAGGGFLVNGSVRDIAEKLNADDWATFQLAESQDKIMIRSAQVVALREGQRGRRHAIGFVHEAETG